MFRNRLLDLHMIRCATLMAISTVAMPPFSMAFAQDVAATAPGFVVDTTPLINYAFEILGLVATAVAVLGVRALQKWLKARTGIEISADMRDYALRAIERGVELGLDKARGEIASKSKLEVRDAIVATTVNYAVNAVPEALARLQITPEGLAALAEAFLAKKLNVEPELADAIDAPPVPSPATPIVPASATG